MPVTLRGADIVAKELRERLDLAPLFRGPIPKAIKENIGAQFAAQAWFAPDGRIVPWEPASGWPMPVGGRVSQSQALGGAHQLGIASGDYYDALVGNGPGGYVKVGPRSARVGVDRQRFPYQEYLRGGTGSRIRTAPYIIRPKKRAKAGRSKSGKFYRRTGPQQWAMWWYILGTFGIALSEATMQRGLRLPPRPHGTVNPALFKVVAALISRKIRQGRL